MIRAALAALAVLAALAAAALSPRVERRPVVLVPLEHSGAAGDAPLPDGYLDR